MKVRFNEELLLWAIGVLQPASVGDAIAFIREIFPEVQSLPRIKDLDPVVSRWLDGRYIIRVHGKSRLYSLSYIGNHRLSIPLRRHRDKTRLFLLKSARDVRFAVSGEAQKGMAGASPAVKGSSDTQEGSRPISSDGVPRQPRNPARTYGTRVIKQLNVQVGSKPRSPDTFFEYYSFPTVAAVHAAGDGQAAADDLSITDLAVSIGISPRLLTSFTHKPARHYRQFEIGKRGGGIRLIHSPRTFLKVVQYWLLDYALHSLPVHDSAHAYRVNHSILTNAAPHVGRRFVANIDIENFFGSITKSAVERLLVESGFGVLFSNSIAKLTTLDDALPQGAPTSPRLSNSFLYTFDTDMKTYTDHTGVAYTRYADDSVPRALTAA